MKNFQLQIVTPDGAYYDGDCAQLTAPAVDGEVGILAGHLPFVTALKQGTLKIITENGTRQGICAGGMLTVSRTAVRVLASSFEWKN